MINAKKQNNFKKNKERGAILFTSTIMLVSLVILALPFVFHKSTQLRLTEKSYKSTSALSLAEAGVERAIWELNFGDISTWEGDSSLRSKGITSFQASGGEIIGDIDISVENPSGENPIVESTGSVILSGTNIINKTVRVVLEGQGSSLFDFGMFGDQGILLKSNAKVDSYDSRDGLYGGDNVNGNGDIGANATHYGCIELKSNAKIYGDAVSGPESDPDSVIVLRSNSHIYGEKEALSSEKELTSTLPPEGLPFRGSYYLGSNDEDTISESGEYTSFRLRSNSKVTITADVTFYITGDFSMRSNTQLIIAESASLILYLGGSFEQRSNTQIYNSSKDPTKLQVYGTDSFNGNMDWDSNSQFYGAVYVPKANVYFKSNIQFYGSIVSKYIELNSNAKIHYDEALTDIDTPTESGNSSYSVKSWQEKYNQGY